MAKGRKLKKVSNKTTELLDIDELKAISSGDYEIGDKVRVATQQSHQKLLIRTFVDRKFKFE